MTKAQKAVSIAEIRVAVANYMWSEGCSCCRDSEAHEQHAEVLAKMLRVPKYKDGSGYDFSRFRKACAAAKKGKK